MNIIVKKDKTKGYYYLTFVGRSNTPLKEIDNDGNYKIVVFKDQKTAREYANNQSFVKYLVA